MGCGEGADACSACREQAMASGSWELPLPWSHRVEMPLNCFEE